MRRQRSRIIPAARLMAALALLPLAAGCNDKPPVETSSAEAKVTGTVTINGKPMKGGEIRFDPANHRRDAPLKTGPISNDGRFEVSTLVGHNSVRVTGPDIVKDPALSYGNHSIEVSSSGPNTLDINLQSDPPKKSSSSSSATSRRSSKGS